jgi:hypothetical protein
VGHATCFKQKKTMAEPTSAIRSGYQVRPGAIRGVFCSNHWKIIGHEKIAKIAEVSLA